MYNRMKWDNKNWEIHQQTNNSNKKLKRATKQSKTKKATATTPPTENPVETSLERQRWMGKATHKITCFLFLLVLHSATCQLTIVNTPLVEVLVKRMRQAQPKHTKPDNWIDTAIVNNLLRLEKLGPFSPTFWIAILTAALPFNKWHLQQPGNLRGPPSVTAKLHYFFTVFIWSLQDRADPRAEASTQP